MECESRSRDSAAWGGIIKSLDNVKEGFGWNVGAGDGISFWFDTWLDQDRIYLRIIVIHPDEVLCTIRDVMLPDGRINLSLIRTSIPFEKRRLWRLSFGNIIGPDVVA